MTTRNLTCVELDERLGDYLEGSLDDASVADLELHLSGCPACTALVRDFERITRDAATLPTLTPSHDLWPAIAQRLAAPVADLGAHAAAKRSPDAAAGASGVAGSARWHRLRLGAIAAGLVGITAISTYYLTRRGQDSNAASVAAARPDSGRAPAAPGGADVSPGPRVDAGTPTTGSGATLPGAPATGAQATATLASRNARLPARDTYDAEISSLRGIVSQRRDQLDPRTVAVLETSIATIDSAIADARRALDADPASRFLSTQLNKALEKKLGLLRTAALLPSVT
ncbi:MAG: zf-HC2 domain-containing protein [Gemmatimonadaceae bacterium]|nr:zf-HC2 domain-containing protein [Gemmatimonadaceae bacterium]